MPFSIRPHRRSPVQCALIVPLCALAVLVAGIPSAIGQPSILPAYIFRRRRRLHLRSGNLDLGYSQQRPILARLRSSDQRNKLLQSSQDMS
jgi:hypothetical protein